MNENVSCVKSPDLPRERAAAASIVLNMSDMSELVLAADVGGTKTWLGLFRRNGARPTALETRRVQTLGQSGLGQIITDFLDQTGATDRIAAACVGVAGPVRDNASQLTNVPWLVDGAVLAAQLGLPTVRVLNDLEATAYAVPWLDGDELAVIHPGRPMAGGTAAVIAPGTGLGEAWLYSVDHRHHARPSEAGHADFAARTKRELELVASLTQAMGRVSVEDVVSGPGLVRLHRFAHGAAPCESGSLPDDPALQPAAVTAAGLNGGCDACREALDLFVSALGAEAGNLALRVLPTGGLYVGGGIAPHIVPAIQGSRFLDALSSKGRMRALVEQIPVFIILEPQAALIGAATQAVQMHLANHASNARPLRGRLSVAGGASTGTLNP